MRITFLGNFGPAHSTENDLLWTLRDMGHDVSPEPEDSIRGVGPAFFRDAELFLWVHTHGWDWVNGDSLLQGFRERNIPTAAFHLDLYRGLNREDMVGSHPFFKVDYFFGVDGRSHMDGWYKSKGVNHHLILPGVVKRDCYLAEPKDEYVCDVGFVGSYGYHPEHAWRRQLIDWLQATYGPRFKKFGNPEPTLRGHELNRFYASCKVVVGDSCHLPGNHHYWSDRPYETVGRGGFIIMPSIPGLLDDVPRMITYEMGNFDDLKQKIDSWVNVCDSRRNELRLSIHEHVKKNCTYHNRMQAMLETIFGGKQ